MIFASIRHNQANLFRFSGRESRALFWPYAVAISLLLLAPHLMLFLEELKYVSVLQPDFSWTEMPLTLADISSILLVAAAVVRRLHDSGRSGWWGALPLAMTAFSCLPPLLPSASINDLVAFCWLLSTVILIMLLGAEPSPETNRFGDAVRIL